MTTHWIGNENLGKVNAAMKPYSDDKENGGANANVDNTILGAYKR